MSSLGGTGEAEAAEDADAPQEPGDAEQKENE